MKRMLFGISAGLAAMMAAAPASAVVLLAGSGWQSDSVTVAGQPSQNSPWSFTVLSSAILSLTDGALVGDTYTLSGDISGSSVVGAGANDLRADGTFYGLAWLNPVYGKFSQIVGPGTYNFSITGDGGGGLPAGFAIRLDLAQAAIPEMGTWLLMLLGFGLIGAAMRRSKPKVNYAW